ncbi:SpoIIE family protein phosphatase [Streptomyces spirodelae]|uniref:SpoIIE family protein phosphatase n=1 Tax=Streptomyces spirodelae TaxID=2812904 RepID=A0ABS3WUN0_9ACTN|nr:SpoIIE family protein phosphatase [Streptomyces spirodelae]MBO8186845.1 SpoIIE family protein phosphatase [Streptomyces spirodelae]
MHPPEGATDHGGGLLDALLANLVRDTGASVGAVFLLPPGERALRPVVASGLSRQVLAPWNRVPVDAEIPVTDAVRRRRLVWLTGQEEMARRYPRVGFVLPYDFMLAAAPITGDTTVWGGIVLLWPVWHPPQLSAAEQEAITACCRRAAELLQQAADSGRPLEIPHEPRLLPALHPHTADPARAMAALGFAERLPVGCCALDLDGRLTFINSAGAELIGSSAASLLGKRPWEVLPWLYHPVFEDRYREAMFSRQPTAFTAERPPDSRLSFQLYPDDSGISIHITPTAKEPTATDDVGAAALSTAGPVGATALYHLTYLATALAEAFGVQDVVETAADQIVPGFGPKAMALQILEEGRLQLTSHRGYSPELVARFGGTPLHSGTPAARVVTTGVASFFATFADLKRAYPQAHEDDMASWAFLPLTVSGSPVGSLILAYDEPHPFPPAERALLMSLAGLIAQAVDRARLYDAKHALAHALQTGLLPHALPRLSGLEVAARYQPADHGVDIGGDFYDLIRCTPTTAVAAIGDVQGHNTTAAALMGQVRTAVHGHAAVGTSPHEVLARTNRLLTDLDPGLFASCLIAHLDLTNHRALLATAGHPPALLRHPDGRTDIVHLPPGLLLGIDPDAGYSTTEAPLPPGAVLVLYTDGLVEWPGCDIDDAISALARHLEAAEPESLEALADGILRQAERSAPRHDDIALLLIRAADGP